MGSTYKSPCGHRGCRSLPTMSRAHLRSRYCSRCRAGTRRLGRKGFRPHGELSSPKVSARREGWLLALKGRAPDASYDHARGPKDGYLWPAHMEARDASRRLPGLRSGETLGSPIFQGSPPRERVRCRPTGIGLACARNALAIFHLHLRGPSRVAGPERRVAAAKSSRQPCGRGVERLAHDIASPLSCQGSATTWVHGTDQS